MGKIIELIKNFIEPKKQQTFDELAMASGISEGELRQLKSTMNGIDWNSFSKEDEKKINKKVPTTKEISNNDKVNVHKRTVTGKNKDNDIEIEK